MTMPKTSLVQSDVLQERLSTISQSLPPSVVSTFAAMLTSADDAALFRMNPLRYAHDHPLSELEAIELFLRATQAGVLTMHWGIVCPMCGDVVRSFATLGKVESHFTCRLCNVQATADLDDCIAVSFDVAENIRAVRYGAQDTLSIQEFLGVCRFRYIGTTEDGRSYREVFAGFARMAAFVEPGVAQSGEFRVSPGSLQIFDFASEHGLILPVEGDASETRQNLVVECRGGKFVASLERLVPGPVRLTLDAGDLRRPMVVNNLPPMLCLPRRLPEKFLTGKRLFTNQTFCELFRSEKIASTEGINIKDLTILFTDLK